MKNKSINDTPHFVTHRGTTRGAAINGKPLVSVIMPVYNAGAYLAEAIDSIRNQTVTDWEFLIVDDGSTDNTWKILTRYAKSDKRIRLYRNPKNRGIVWCLNFLIPKTRGKYVARMDGDDISLPRRFEKQIALLESDRKLIAVGGQEEIIDEKGRTVAEKYFPTDPATCRRMILNLMVIQPPVLLARGAAVRKIRLDNHIHVNDDISLHFHLITHGDFTNVDSIIYQYRHRPGSVTHKHPKQMYFLALQVRLKAILSYGYKPAFVNLILLVPETILVLCLPDRLIISLFTFLRYTKELAQPAFSRLRLLFAGNTVS